MANAIKAWQCIGCGRVEAPEPCIGVCRDKRIELVDAAEYHRVQVRFRELERRARRLEAVVRQMALSTPRNEAWEQSYMALKERALAALAKATSGD